MVEKRRSHERLDQFRADRSARVDCIKSAGLPSEKIVRGFSVRTANYVNDPWDHISCRNAD